MDPWVLSVLNAVTDSANIRKMMLTMMMTAMASMFLLNPRHPEKPDVKGFPFKPNTLPSTYGICLDVNKRENVIHYVI